MNISTFWFLTDPFADLPNKELENQNSMIGINFCRSLERRVQAVIRGVAEKLGINISKDRLTHFTIELNREEYQDSFEEKQMDESRSGKISRFTWESFTEKAP